MAASTTKRVRVCLRSVPRPALDCPEVTLDLAAITSWSRPLLAALAAAGATALAGATTTNTTTTTVTVTAVWLREDDNDDEPERLDDRPKKGWKKLLGMDSDEAVLLLNIEHACGSRRCDHPLQHDILVIIGPSDLSRIPRL